MINKFVEEMSELMLAVHDYERRVTIASPTLGLQKHSARTNPCATRTAAPRRSRNRHPPHQADCSHVNNILLRSRGFANLSACIARAKRVDEGKGRDGATARERSRQVEDVRTEGIRTARGSSSRGMCVSLNRTRTSLDCRRDLFNLNLRPLQDVAARWEDLVLAEAEQARLIDSSITRCVAPSLGAVHEMQHSLHDDFRKQDP